jgi:hypothetical protein
MCYMLQEFVAGTIIVHWCTGVHMRRRCDSTVPINLSSSALATWPRVLLYVSWLLRRKALR